MGKLLHNMDIQLCCFLAGIYICVHLFGCQNKSKCFQKFKSSNVFYARERQMMPVAMRTAALRRSNIGSKQLYSHLYIVYIANESSFLVSLKARIFYISVSGRTSCSKCSKINVSTCI